MAAAVTTAGNVVVDGTGGHGSGSGSESRKGGVGGSVLAVMAVAMAATTLVATTLVTTAAVAMASRTKIKAMLIVMANNRD